MRKRRGNCYVACEALYHLLGGKAAGYQPATVRHEGEVHWFLVHCDNALKGMPARVLLNSMGQATVLDPTASQFRKPVPYHKARGRGFLTKGPSRRARELMEAMVWQ